MLRSPRPAQCRKQNETAIHAGPSDSRQRHRHAPAHQRRISSWASDKPVPHSAREEPAIERSDLMTAQRQAKRRRAEKGDKVAPENTRIAPTLTCADTEREQALGRTPPTPRSSIRACPRSANARRNRQAVRSRCASSTPCCRGNAASSRSACSANLPVPTCRSAARRFRTTPAAGASPAVSVTTISLFP